MSEITEKAKDLIKILKIIPQHKTTSLELSIDRQGEQFNVGLRVIENDLLLGLKSQVSSEG